MDNQQPIHISIEIPETKDKAFLKVNVDEPEILIKKIVAGEDKVEVEFNPQNIMVEFTIRENEVTKNTFHFYSLSGEQLIGEIEFWHTSESYLKSRHNFTRPFGNVFLGRCTFDLSKPDTSFEFLPEERILVVGEFERVPIEMMFEEVLPGKLSVFNERTDILQKADVITQFLCTILKEFGSSDLIDGQKLGLYEKLHVIYKDGGTVICGGMRDLFIELFKLFDNTVELRKVNIFRYFPQIRNIDTNSHALLEIKIAGKWVAYDPTYRVYFTSASGDLMSVEDIYNSRRTNKLDEINIIHIDTRMGMYEGFDPEIDPFDMHNYNYFSTFGYIQYINLEFIHYDHLLHESERLIEESNLEGAQDIINSFLSENPNDVNMLNNLAIVKILWGGLIKLGEAEVILDKILEIDPNNEVALGNLSYLKGEYIE